MGFLETVVCVYLGVMVVIAAVVVVVVARA